MNIADRKNDNLVTQTRLGTLNITKHTCQSCVITMYLIATKYTTIHYTAKNVVHYDTLHYTTQHYKTLHYTKLHSNTCYTIKSLTQGLSRVISRRSYAKNKDCLLWKELCQLGTGILSFLNSTSQRVHRTAAPSTPLEPAVIGPN